MSAVDVEQPELRQGSGVSSLNTERASRAGLQRGFDFMVEHYPEKSRTELELLVNITRTDWAAGREEAVKKRLEKEYGVLLTAMFLAHLLADAWTGQVTDEERAERAR